MVYAANVQQVPPTTAQPHLVSQSAKPMKHSMEQHVSALLASTESTEYAASAHLEPLTTEPIKLAIVLSIKFLLMELVHAFLILFESMEFADHALPELSLTL